MIHTVATQSVEAQGHEPEVVGGGGLLDHAGIGPGNELGHTDGELASRQPHSDIKVPAL